MFIKKMFFLIRNFSLIWPHNEASHYSLKHPLNLLTVLTFPSDADKLLRAFMTSRILIILQRPISVLAPLLLPLATFMHTQPLTIHVAAQTLISLFLTPTKLIIILMYSIFQFNNKYPQLFFGQFYNSFTYVIGSIKHPSISLHTLPFVRESNEVINNLWVNSFACSNNSITLVHSAVLINLKALKLVTTHTGAFTSLTTHRSLCSRRSGSNN